MLLQLCGDSKQGYRNSTASLGQNSQVLRERKKKKKLYFEKEAAAIVDKHM